MRPIGWCLVMSGLLAGSVRTASAQLSPGPLARAHASLEGTRQCLSCHPVGRREAMDGACLACHGEIAWLRLEGRGLHAKEARARCATCHPDHLGRDFALIAWNQDSLARFNHARAGWALEGGHREVKCDACHAPRLRVSPAARLAPQGAKGRWTGLERSCTSCHEDIHRDRFRVEEPTCPPDCLLSGAHVSVDTPEDLEKMRRIFDALYDGRPIETDRLVAWLVENAA